MSGLVSMLHVRQRTVAGGVESAVVLSDSTSPSSPVDSVGRRLPALALRPRGQMQTLVSAQQQKVVHQKMLPKMYPSLLTLGIVGRWLAQLYAPRNSRAAVVCRRM